MNKEIYIVIVYSKNNNWTNVSQECYDTKEKAIEFVESRLTNEDIERHNKQLKRGLISWYEYSNKNDIYEIKILSLR